MWKNWLTKAEEIMVNEILKNSTGFNFEQIQKLAQDKKELDFLNEYRWALSLWAEHTADTKDRIIVTLDWRDTAWKGSNIKRVTEYFDIKRHNEVAFGIPTLEERFEDNWFKRYERFFPEPWKVTFFDRSWYNRASVEAAMWFCTEEEYNWFMQNVNNFEKERIIEEWIKFIKIYLSVTKETQKLRLKNRQQARKRWKSSPIDAQAQEKWNYYTLAKAKILELTNSEYASWTILDSNEKWLSSIEIIKAIINTTDEVAKLVSNDLSLDLSPNREIVRTASEELERMEKAWDLKNMKENFNFKK